MEYFRKNYRSIAQNTILASFSCIAGAVAALLGGVLPATLTIMAITLATLLWFGVFKQFFSKPSLDTSSSLPAGKTIVPPDRIDELTGLANENGLMAWFSEQGARVAADKKGIIILSADLADFEQIERTRGTKIAEAVLIEVAGRVNTCAGEDGIAARTTGDEFAAIASVVPEQSEAIAAEHAGKLAELIQRPVELPAGVIWIGGSVGAAYGKVSESVKVLENARKALKKAQVLGRGHYVVYRPE